MIKQAMVCLCAGLAINSFGIICSRADDLDSRIKTGVDLIKLGCGTGSESSHVEVSGGASGGLTLKRLPGIEGNGTVKYSKDEAQGLVAALKNELADGGQSITMKQLDCMKPYVDSIFAVLFPKPPVIPNYSSGWVEGGHGYSTNTYCIPQKEAYEKKYPGFRIEMTPLTEGHQVVGTGPGKIFKHDEYNYSCSFAAIPK